MESSSSETQLSDPGVEADKCDGSSTEDYWTVRGFEPLHYKWDVKKIKRRLNDIDGAVRFHNLTPRKIWGTTALHVAASGGRVEIAAGIIRSTDSEDRDYVIYCIDDYGQTPLHKAQSSAMAKILLDGLTPQARQKIIKHRDVQGRAALHIAVCSDKVEVVDLIITSTDSEDRDYVISCVNDDGNTPLDKAESFDMAKTLLDGLTPSTRHNCMKLSSSKRRAMLHASVVCDREEVANLLIRSTDSANRDSVITCVDDNGRTLLHKTLSSAMAKKLLDGLTPQTRQQLVKHRDRQGSTALHRAVHSDNVEVVDQIIRSTDSEDRDSLIICCTDEHGRTLLHKAKSSAMAKTLLAELTPQTRQQLIKHRDNAGHTAVTYAIGHEKPALFYFLWEQSDLSTQQDISLGPRKHYGDSLLMLAGMMGDREVLRFLLSNILEDSWEEIVDAASSSGATLTQCLILHRLHDFIAEVLRPLSLEKRRAHLALQMELRPGKVKRSSFDLALIPARDSKMMLFHCFVLSSSFSSFSHSYISYDKFSDLPSNDVLKVLHLLTNEYSITSPVSIIQCTFPSVTTVSPHQIYPGASAVTVSMSALFCPNNM